MPQDQTQAAPQLSATYQPIENYAVIGDLHTVALVGMNGSIDWCCLPRFDSPSLFGALLDVNKGGFFRIAPPDTPGMGKRQLYLPQTNILITRFLTVDGVAELTDFMPIKQETKHTHQHHIVRSIAVVRGSLSFDMVCRPAFNYAQDAHTVQVSGHVARFHSESLSLALVASVPLEEDGAGGIRAHFTLQQGQSARFILESAKDANIPSADHSEYRY